MRALIVDDNAIARTTLKQLATHVKDIEVVGECDNATDAYQMILGKQIDLVLLDIEMDGMSGIELTRNLGDAAPVVIFTTSKTEYAVEAFELHVADYLVKPVLLNRFLQAIDRAREIIKSAEETVQIKEDEFLFFRDSNIVRRLALEEIQYIEAMGDYVKIFTPKKFFAVHATLKSVEERLPSRRFQRVHRSYMVAVDKIDTIQDGALIVSGKAIPVADAYRAALNKRMNVI